MDLKQDKVDSWVVGIFCILTYFIGVAIVMFLYAD